MSDEQQASAPADPSLSITVLKVPVAQRGEHKLCKVFRKDDKGRIEKVDYSSGKFFEIASKQVSSIVDWAAFQLKLQKAPYACVVRGQPTPSVNPARAQRLLSNFPECPRRWLLVDYDKPELPRGEAGADAARQLLPPEFHNIPCWWQRTGSYGVAHTTAGVDPWSTRIRLAFILDHALTAPQIKYWLKHSKCDLAIYTPNQINYTAAPLFEGMADPVVEAGESRFGTLDMDAPLVDEVPVPKEIYCYQPVNSAVPASRPDGIEPSKHAKLLEDARNCDAEDGERHGTVARWVFDAYGLGMDEREILRTGTEVLMRLGRPEKEARPEVERLVKGARRKDQEGNLTVSAHYVPEADFQVAVSPDGAPLDPSATSAQAAQLVQWWDRLKVMSSGGYRSSLDNAAIILGNHTSMTVPCGKNGERRPILAYDDFQNRPVWTEPPPWWPARGLGNVEVGPLGVQMDADHDSIDAAVWLGQLDPASGDEGTPVHVQPKAAYDALMHVARSRRVNPIREYLDMCADKWDKRQRINDVLKSVCHAKCSEKLARVFFPKWMMQAVARVYRPGSKCDNVLVLIGGQGARKSSFFRNLVPWSDMFIDDIGDLRNKDARQILRGKWIVEFGEMLNTKRDVDYLKSYIAACADTYRASYARDDQARPRTCVFCASSNDDTCITDSGGRRWWVVETLDEHEVKAGKVIDLARVIAERDNWWGEAVTRYRAGEQWWLDPGEDRAARAVALSHSAGLEQATDILTWLEKGADRGGAPHKDIVRPMDVWTEVLARPRSAWNSASGRIIADLMRALPEFVRTKVCVRNGPTEMFYIRIGSQMALDTGARNKYILASAGNGRAELLNPPAA